MIYDFHTHTFLSDGTLSPLELIRRAKTKGYQAIALTDHVGLGSLERVIREGLRQLPIRPVYLVSMEHNGEQNIITIGMFAFFSGDPSLVGIGVRPNRHSYSLWTSIRCNCLGCTFRTWITRL